MKDCSENPVNSMSTPLQDGFHMPGEYEPHRGCVMIWPTRPGSWPYGAKEAQQAFMEVACAIAESETVWMLAAPDQAESVREAFQKYIGKNLSGQKPSDSSENNSCMLCAPNIYLLPIETDDAWARDVGPTFVVRDADRMRETACDTDGREVRDADKMKEAACDAGKMKEVVCDADKMREPACDADGMSGMIQETGSNEAPDSLGEVRGIDWQFNAWGGFVDGLYAHWEKDNQAASAICQALGIDCYNAQHFVMEGGAIHSDGEGTVLVTSTCLLSAGRNPRMFQSQIEETLKQYLGAEKIIWLPRGIWNDETNEHVDNVCAFVHPGEVVLAWTDDETDPQWALSNASLRMLERETDARGRKIIVHKLPVPAKPVCITKEELDGFIFEEGEDTREAGERLAASYVNFYVSNGAVIVPQFGDVNDALAVELLSGLFPERKVVPIYARPILAGGGNIHCITQQIPLGL